MCVCTRVYVYMHVCLCVCVCVHLFLKHYSVQQESNPAVDGEPTIMARVQISFYLVCLGPLPAPRLFCDP